MKSFIDVRTGQRPVLLVPASNSASALRTWLPRYTNAFDVVIMDNGSTDDSREVAAAAGASVFVVGASSAWQDHFCEFVHRHGAPSVFHAILRLDEYVLPMRLFQAVLHCSDRNKLLLGRRVHWFYGRRLMAGSDVRFLGALPKRFNVGLLAAENLKPLLALPNLVGAIDVEHFQYSTAKRNFGTYGGYAMQEIANFAAENRLFRGYFRRFVGREIVKFPYFVLRDWRGVSSFFPTVGGALVSLAGFMIGTIALIEHLFLPTEADQRAAFDAYRQGLGDEQGD